MDEMSGCVVYLAGAWGVSTHINRNNQEFVLLLE